MKSLIKSLKILFVTTALIGLQIGLTPQASQAQATVEQGIGECYRSQIKAGFEWYTNCDELLEQSTTRCTGVGLEELDGHRLPATRGGAGKEQHLRIRGDEGEGGADIAKHYEITRPFSSDVIDYNDAGKRTAVENGYAGTNGGRGAPGFGALGTDDPASETWYINMRWRYALWNWNGTSTTEGAPEDVEFYRSNPRLLVTNPRTGKSIVAVAIESGPAPWTGTPSGDRNDSPPYWQGAVDGTPTDYDGRVAGLSPEAMVYLEVNQWNFGDGDELIYGWAPNQNSDPGPVETSAVPTGDCGSLSAGDFIKQPTFTGDPIDPTGIVLHWTGTDPYISVDGFINAISSNAACPGGCSVQFFVDGYGDVYQLVDEINTLTAHAGGYNSCCIGIEIAAGSGSTNSQRLSNAPVELISNNAQRTAVVDLVVYLAQKFDIPVAKNVSDSSGIFSHHMLPGNEDKSDVGDEYYDYIFNEMQGRLNGS